tara:strand:+ start:671 stop:1510 length:840 start_codon:yes stop_codon:yes gene_type:complete
MKDNGKSGGEGFEGKAATLADPRGGEKAAEKPKRKRKHRSLTALTATAAKAAATRAAKKKAAVEATVAAAKAVIAEAGAPPVVPPLTPAEVKAEAAARKRSERERADAARGSALIRLLNKGRIDQSMFIAGAHLRSLWTVVDVTSLVPALDMTRERVDGGKVRSYVHQGLGFAEASEHELRRLILASGMGDEAAWVLMQICQRDKMPTQIAIEMESEPSAKKRGECTRETQALVRHLMRTGLLAAFDAIRRQRREGAHLAGMREWLAAGHAPAAMAART